MDIWWSLHQLRAGTQMVDLSVTIAGISFKNPVLTASGTFGYGLELASLLDLNVPPARISITYFFKTISFPQQQRGARLPPLPGAAPFVTVISHPQSGIGHL